MRVGCTNPFFLKMSNSAGAPFLKLAEKKCRGSRGRLSPAEYAAAAAASVSETTLL